MKSLKNFPCNINLNFSNAFKIGIKQDKLTIVYQSLSTFIFKTMCINKIDLDFIFKSLENKKKFNCQQVV